MDIHAHSNSLLVQIFCIQPHFSSVGFRYYVVNYTKLRIVDNLRYCLCYSDLHVSFFYSLD